MIHWWDTDLVQVGKPEPIVLDAAQLEFLWDRDIFKIMLERIKTEREDAP